MKTAQQLVDEVKSRILEVSVTQLAEALQQQQAILIDVREPEEYHQGAIKGAVNYPRGVLEMKIHQHPACGGQTDAVAALNQLAEQPLYLICRSGARSALAADALQSMGFRTVYSVAGGMLAWTEAGLPL